MRFNSWQFLLFFPCVTALYYLLPEKFRWALLLIAGGVFYMAFVPAYLLHYRPLVGDAMIDALFSTSTTNQDIVHAFGARVSRENVKEHLNALKTQLLQEKRESL